MAAFKDITGQRFGRLVTVSRVRRRTPKRSLVYWLCRCDCGAELTILAASLVHGRTRSCGCSKGDAARSRPTSHGLKHTGAYKSWQAMRSRCLHATDNHYHSYGGRGIKICERWSRFLNFYADMGDRPEGMTLDRMNRDGHYEPSNCRWATLREQARNTSQNRIIEHNGERRCLAEWAEIHALPFETLRQRAERGETPPRMFRPVERNRMRDSLGKFIYRPTR